MFNLFSPLYCYVVFLYQTSDIDVELVSHLERLSLVNFDDSAAVDCLRQAISLAETLQQVDTSGVEPLETLHEQQ